jgi:hypothetical protein
MVNQGDDDVHPGSLIWVNSGDLYVIIANRDGTFNLGRFNTDLFLQARSRVAVHPNAMVSVQQGLILTQGSDGRSLLLNPGDLTEK